MKHLALLWVKQEHIWKEVCMMSSGPRRPGSKSWHRMKAYETCRWLTLLMRVDCWTAPSSTFIPFVLLRHEGMYLGLGVLLLEINESIDKLFPR